MNKAQLKNLTNKLITIVLALALMLTCLGMLSLNYIKADADDAGAEQPKIVISNSEFSDSSGSYPKTPSSWTGAGVNNSPSTVVKSGVIDLTTSSYTENKKAYKLDSYLEYAETSPVTRNNNEIKDTLDNNVLMINTAESETAYGYTSQSITLEANKYYQISAWVKTGNFINNTGAYMKLTGMENEVAFANINTVATLKTDAEGLPILNAQNNYGWEKYNFFIKNSSYKSSSVTLSLQVGDSTTDSEKTTNNPAKGYAFFDTIESNELEPELFNFLTSSDVIEATEENDYRITNGENTLYNIYKATPIKTDKGDIAGNFEFTIGERPGWSLADNSLGAINTVFNTNAYDEENNINLKTNPHSPTGNTKIFAISSYDNSTELYNEAAMGIKSDDITIKRQSFSRLSVWVKDIDIQNGSGATVVISGKDGKAATNYEFSSVQGNLTGDESATTRYGWKEKAFYIKGSAFRDYPINVELWLGQKDSKSKGTALFDDVNIETLTSAQFNENSANGTVIDFDDTLPDLGITNGAFNLAGDYTEYKYPLAPSGWSLLNAATVTTSGMSTDKVDKIEKVISGIVPIDEDHFNENQANYGGASNPSNHISNGPNVLMMASSNPTAACYQSSAFTLPVDGKKKLSVTMKVVGIDGYGANIVVKSGNNILTTIEQITETSDFQTFDIYLQGGLSEKTDLVVEVWLGLNDSINNKSKLSSGYLFIDNVKLADMADSENYAAKAGEYYNLKSGSTIKKTNFSVYTFAKEMFNAYDYFQKDSFVKTPYNWTVSANGTNAIVNNETVKYGIFDAGFIWKDQADIPYTFKHTDRENPHVLLLKNIAKTSSKLTNKFNYNLAASSYYKITISMKVDMTQDQIDNTDVVGAGIALTGTKYKFENIKDTSLLVDKNNPDSRNKEIYRDFIFYVNTDTSSPSVGFDISLGGSKNSKQYASGSVYVNSIEVLSINNTDYELSVKNLLDKDPDNDDPYIINANLKATDEDTKPDEPTEKAPIQWWLIPSILFAVAILLALVGTLVRRLVSKRQKHVKIEKVSSYDRSKTLDKIHNANTTDQTKKVETTSVDDGYENFADDTDLALVKPKATQTKVETDNLEPKEQDSSAPKVEAPTSTVSKKIEKTEEQPIVDRYKDEFED